MGESGRLRLRDARDACRLIGECVELGRNPQAWRRRMLEGLCRMTGAAVGVGGEITRFQTPQARTITTVDVGWSRDSRAVWLRYQQSGKQHDPLYRRISHALSSSNRPVLSVSNGPALSPSIRSVLRSNGQAPRRCITRAREQLLPDRDWYGSDYFEQYQQSAGVDSRLISIHRCPMDRPEAVNVITLQRPLGERAFSPRDRRLLHMFHCELGPLVGSKLAGAEPNSLIKLFPRLRQTLACLLEGDSEKQIAIRLGISHHTVHDYVKRLHVHFNVQSRGELLACFIRAHTACRDQRRNSIRFPAPL